MKPNRILAEPLLHFALLGAIVFLLHGWWTSLHGDRRVIRVDARLERELAEGFHASTGREPTPAEQASLIEAWVRSEVLYREGLALGLDRGDAMIRKRVSEKMGAVLREGVVVAEPDEDALLRWFEHHRKDYGEPRRYDFVQVPLAGAEAAPARAEQLVEALRAGADPLSLGHPPRPVRGRSRHQLVSVFGEGFADGLDALAPGAWGLLYAHRGPHLVRLEQISGGSEPAFALVRERVLEDWRRARTLDLIAEHTRALRAAYRVVRIGA